MANGVEGDEAPPAGHGVVGQRRPTVPRRAGGVSLASFASGRSRGPEPAVPYGAAVVGVVVAGGTVVVVVEDDVDPVPAAPLLLSTVTLDTFQPAPVMVRSVWIWSSSADGDVILLLT